jgi:predicted nucleic acid-binding protein
MQRLGGEALVDTSVVVKFFFDEPDSERADAILRRCRRGELLLVVADLLFAEFTNAAWTKTLRGQATVREAESRIEKFFWLVEQVSILRTADFVRAAFRHSCRYREAVYDTVLLAAAESRGISMVTADVRLYEKARSDRRAVLLLSDLQV